MKAEAHPFWGWEEVTEVEGMTKAERIKESLHKTKERRKPLKPKVFQLKLQNLTKTKEERLRKAFLGAK